MQAIRLHARGGPEAFASEEAPQPRPGEAEVLVRVHAAAMTPTELVGVPTWTTPTGEPRRFPIILGHEFSGEVAAVGDGVTDVAVGNPVYGLNDWFGDGARVEYDVARAAEVAPKPRSVDALVVFQNLYFHWEVCHGDSTIEEEMSMVLVPVTYPYGHSAQIIKGGHTETSKQRYRYQQTHCPHRSFVLEPASHGRLPHVKAQIIEMALNGSGIRDTARVVKISPATVMNEWQKKRRR